MISKNDILTALQNGEDAKAIADSFAAALNAAIKENDDAKMRANQQIQKIKRAEAILTDVMDFMEEFYPEVYDNQLRTALDAKAIVKAMDEARDEVVRITPALENLQKLVETEKDDPLDAFLRNHGLKL